MKTTQFDRLPPGRAGDLAFERFWTPLLSKRRSADHEALAARARFHLRGAKPVSVETPAGRIQAYVLEPDAGAGAAKTVLVAHGWTSEASFMAVIGEQLRRAGLRAVLLDFPAHGLSDGRRGNLVEGARAIIAVAHALGPVSFVVAHSMGCLTALLAAEGRAPLPGAVAFERAVLIASPNGIRDLMDEDADQLNLDAPARRHFYRRMERMAGRPLSEISAAHLLARTGLPALLVHARDDGEVPFRRAEEITAAYPRVELAAFDGFGHRLILSAPPAIRRIVAAFTGR